MPAIQLNCQRLLKRTQQIVKWSSLTLEIIAFQCGINYDDFEVYSDMDLKLLNCSGIYCVAYFFYHYWKVIFYVLAYYIYILLYIFFWLSNNNNNNINSIIIIAIIINNNTYYYNNINIIHR